MKGLRLWKDIHQILCVLKGLEHYYSLKNSLSLPNLSLSLFSLVFLLLVLVLVFNLQIFLEEYLV